MNCEKMKQSFPLNIPFPIELEQLIDWANQNGYPISGYFKLRAGDSDTMFYWFGFRHVDDKLASALVRMAHSIASGMPAIRLSQLCI